MKSQALARASMRTLKGAAAAYHLSSYGFPANVVAINVAAGLSLRFYVAPKGCVY
jgi:hypothetical protein